MTAPAATPLRVAALRYCAGGSFAETLPRIEPLITAAAGSGAGLVCLPEAATFLAANRRSLDEEAEWEDDSPTLRRLSALAADLVVAQHPAPVALRHCARRLVLSSSPKPNRTSTQPLSRSSRCTAPLPSTQGEARQSICSCCTVASGSRPFLFGGISSHCARLFLSHCARTQPP